MVVRVNYKIRSDKAVYPIRADDRCLDIEPLQKLCDDVQEFISCVQKANVLIDYADGNHLLDISRAIAEEIDYGRDDLEALTFVSYKFNISLKQVFLAYSLIEDYRIAYENYIMANVIRILNGLGLKPMQIYRKINSLEGVYYQYRGILEILKAWENNNYKELKHYDVKF